MNYGFRAFDPKTASYEEREELLMLMRFYAIKLRAMVIAIDFVMVLNIVLTIYLVREKFEPIAAPMLMSFTTGLLWVCRRYIHNCLVDASNFEKYITNSED